MMKVCKGTIVSQLLFLIDNYSLLKNDNEKPKEHWNTNSKKNSNQLIILQFHRNIFIQHLNQCPNSKSNYRNSYNYKKDCSLCKLFKKPMFENFEMHFLALFNALYDQFKALQQYELKTSSSHRRQELFGWKNEAIQFIHQIMSIKENYYLFSYHIVNVLSKLNSQNHVVMTSNVLSINILTFYKQKLKLLEQSINKINMILLIEKQSTLINNILEEWQHTLFFKVLSPSNLITSAIQINSLRKKVLASINTHENKNNYNSIIIKYIMEKMLSKKLKHGGTFFDITSFDEVLNECYLNNKYLTLTLDLKTQNITILSSGKEFFQYKNKAFRDIFISQYEDFAIEKFKECIREVTDFKGEYRLFQFPIKDLDNPQYLLLFRFKYILLPTINIEECLICGFYRMRKENLILTVVNGKGSKIMNNEERLVSYSYSMKKELIISIDVMEIMKKNKLFINMKNYFAPIDEKNGFGFKYKTFCMFLYKTITHLFKNNEIDKGVNDNVNVAGKATAPATSTANSTEGNEKHIQEKPISYKELKEAIEVNNAKSKNIKFKIKAEFNFPSQNTKMILYSSDQENETRCGLFNNDNDYSIDNGNDHGLSTFLCLGTGSLGSTNPGYSSALNSSYLDNSTSSQLNKQSSNSSSHILNIRFREEYKKKKRQTRNFSIFTFFILGSNLILIVLSIAFLFTQLDKINKFNAMLDLFILWAKLIKLFFNSSLNIFFNFCIGKLNETTCANAFRDYELDLLRDNNLPLTFSIETYIFNELVVKADFLKDLISDVSTDIYSSKEQSIITQAESDFRFRYLSVVENHLEVKEDIYTFLDALKVYMNLINMIIESDDYVTKPLYIINIHGPLIEEVNLDNINLDSPLAQNQITGYNIIFNFPKYIATFFSLNDIIFQLLLQDNEDCKVVVLAFSITIMIIHCILMILCFLFSFFFRRNLETQIIDIHNRLKDPLIREALRVKYSRLKILAGFYKENPNDIVSKFVKEESLKLKEAKELAKGNHSYNANNSNSSTSSSIDFTFSGKKNDVKSSYSSDSYKLVLKSSITLLYSIFGTYFLVSIIFIIVLMLLLSDFTLLINIFSDNVTLDISLSSIIGLLQMTIITNQTEQEMADYLNQTVISMEGGFVQAFISSSFSYMFSIRKEEQKELIPLVETIDCFSFYDVIQDDLFIEVNKRYETFDYSEIIPYICDSYAFMTSNKPRIVMTELIYRSTKLLKTVEYSYDKLYAMNNSLDLFHLYVIMLIVFRPIRSYETISLFKEAILNLSLKNNALTYVYLSCNILIEMLLFFAIQKYVIKRYRLMSKSMNLMINSING